MKRRKARVCALAVLMAVMLPLSVMAKTWDNVDTSDKMAEAFADTDADVVINLTGDITMLSGLEAKIGQTYTINGQEYVLSNVVFYGDGTVEANANLSGDDSNAALSTSGNVDVTVNGDITGENDGVVTQDGSTVTVNGSINVDSDGVIAQGDSSVTVNGDINTVSGEGVYAGDNTTVTVDGDVTAGETGVDAYNDAKVNITGNVTGGSGDPDTVDYDDGGDYSDGETGVYAEDNAAVTVGGDVTGGDAYGTYGYAGDGVYAQETATVTVDGNVTGGSVIADPDTSVVSDWYSEGGHGVEMYSTNNVTVGGNVTGGSTNGDSGIAGCGVYIYLVSNGPMYGAAPNDVPPENTPPTAGKLYVEGTISGGSALTDTAKPASGIYYESDIPESLDDYLLVNNTEEFTTVQDILDDINNNHINNISYAMEDSGATDEDITAEINSIIDDINKVIGAAIGKDTYDPSSADDNNALAALSKDDTNALIKAIADAFNKRASVYAESIMDNAAENLGIAIPEVTLWSVEGAGDAEAVASDIGKLAAQVLNADYNYIVRVADATGGTVKTDKETANPGELVTITATPDTGYKLESVKLNGVALTAVDGVYSFVMPQYGAVEISAEFKAEAAPAPVPKTGDNSNMNMFAVLAAMSLLGLGVITLKLKKSGRTA